MSDFFLNLQLRLVEGLGRWPQALRDRNAAYLTSRQNSDGGFSGREGPSDLYYTGFALRGLATLDALRVDVAQKSADYLRSCLTRQTSVVDFYSFLYACLIVQAAGAGDVLADSSPDWPQRVAQTLETFRTPDHGYNKSPGASGGSTYHTFLVGLCYEMLGEKPPRPDDLAQFILSRRREDSGVVEVGAMRRSGTNPTAAAVGVLQLLERLPDGMATEVSDFLAGMSSDEGGLRANDRVPLADLLSTFTGLWTLHQLGGLDRIDAVQMRAYVLGLEMSGGGFKGGLWDEIADVEYTFYGLGSLALLAPQV